MSYQTKTEGRRAIHGKHLLEKQDPQQRQTATLRLRNNDVEGALIDSAIMQMLQGEESDNELLFHRRLSSRLNELALIAKATIDNLENYADKVHSHTWADITDKPTELPPTAHNHDDRYYTETESDAKYALIGHTHSNYVLNTDTRLSDARTPKTHTHLKADITDFTHTHTKADITDFEHSHSEYVLNTDARLSDARTPLSHSHSEYVLNTDARLSDARTPLTHTHSQYVLSTDERLSDARTPLSHTHTKAQITDFTHTHLKADITDFAHTHLWADITDKPTEFTPSTHSHTWTSITGKPTKFDPTAHSHTYQDLPVYGGVQIGYDHASGLVPQGDMFATDKFLCADSTWKAITVPTHNHDDRYFTETESDARFAPVNHSHDGLYYRGRGSYVESASDAFWSESGNYRDFKLKSTSASTGIRVAKIDIETHGSIAVQVSQMASDSIGINVNADNGVSGNTNIAINATSRDRAIVANGFYKAIYAESMNTAIHAKASGQTALLAEGGLYGITVKTPYSFGIAIEDSWQANFKPLVFTNIICPNSDNNTGHIQIEVNGTTRYLKFYSTPTL